MSSADAVRSKQRDVAPAPALKLGEVPPYLNRMKAQAKVREQDREADLRTKAERNRSLETTENQ